MLPQDCEISEFHLVSDSDLRRVINQPPTKSSQLDPIPTWLLKKHCDVFLPTLTEIVNASLSSGSFPKSLRVGVISPILKKPSQNKDNLKNYRPVSNLPFLGKILEKIVCKQLVDHIGLHHLSDPLQSAYKTGHSTETALLSTVYKTIY